MNNIGTLGIVIGVLALVFAVALVIFAIFLVRRRQVRPAAAGPYGTAGSQAAAMDHDATQVIRPAFIAKQLATAYLEPLENTSEHQGNIPLAEENVSIGRDPKLADIVFGDKSVSRLHARIIKKGSSFQLYDEGSASGTYLNYEQLSLEPQPLRDNDDIHIGRVHVRFRLSAPVVDEDDATQVMQAPPSRQPAAAQASPVDEDTSTKPYMPYTPQDSPQQGPAQEAGGDEDDVSTQPYMPHSPKR